MDVETYDFSTPLVRSTSASHGTYHFIVVPAAIGEVLDGVALMRRLESGRRAGFGSVRLTLRIGATRWLTSAFPFKAHGWSILVSAKVRKAERLVAGEPVEARITL